MNETVGGVVSGGLVRKLHVTALPRAMPFAALIDGSRRTVYVVSCASCELGVIVTDHRGLPLSAPLSVEPNIAWVGYANRSIRTLVEPALRRALASRGLT